MGRRRGGRGTLSRSAPRVLLGASAVGLWAFAVMPIGPTSAVAAASVTPVLSAVATPAELTLGGATTVTGTLAEAGNAVPGAVVALQADSYPFRGYATITRQRTAADGSFSFSGIGPDRNTRLRVVLEGATATAQAPVGPGNLGPYSFAAIRTHETRLT